MSYRRKSTPTVEAFRLGFDVPPAWLATSDKIQRVVIAGGSLNDPDGVILLSPPKGSNSAKRGDWLILDTAANVYALGNAAFNATFEVVP